MSDLTVTRECPEGAALNIAGESFPCDAMEQMHESCDSHDGWAHSNRQAQAIWTVGAS